MPISTKDELLSEIHAVCVDYMKTFRKTPKLWTLNRRFGTLAKRISGVPLKELLKSDSRFDVGHDENLTSYVAVDFE